MKAELVKTTTDDHLVLNGLFVSGNKNRSVILFIHGYAGDFFTNPFVQSIGDKLQTEKYSFLSVQTRGSFGEQWI